jgi:hypothetical protein
MAPTMSQEGAEIAPSRSYVTLLGKLLLAALLLTPLVAMLFPELNHRSGKDASPSGRAAAAAQSSIKDPLQTPFSVRRLDR